LSNASSTAGQNEAKKKSGQFVHSCCKLNQFKSSKKKKPQGFPHGFGVRM
jgi:hypothetical protein